VTANGHELFLRCSGTEGPSVVFVHGLGDNADVWKPTAAELFGVRARLCSYDRLNTGRSGRESSRHTVEDSADDLAGVISAAGLDQPIILVGHSFGGEISMLYAARHASAVRSIVLVDSTLPLEAALDPPDTVEAVRQEMDANTEQVDFYEAQATVGAALADLPPVPVVYLWGTLQEDPAAWAPGAYEAALRSWVASLPHGQLVELATGHAVPLDAPKAVADAVRAALPAG
jgi:pimeloyl-ACP methyl ester carboxylesterase